MTHFKSFIFIVLFTTLSTNASAHSGHKHDSVGIVSGEYLYSKIGIIENVGTYKIEMCTSSQNEKEELVETLISQGLALHHAFQWEDAFRSFNEAISEDPAAPRAYLGMALILPSLRADQNLIKDYLNKGVSAAKNCAEFPQDQLWADAVSIFQLLNGLPLPQGFPVTELGKQLNTEQLSQANVMATLSNILAELIQTYNDPEAKAFAGWDLRNTELLEPFLKEHPNHSGLVHYNVHINENSGQYDKAVAQAEHLVKLANNAPHLLHMYGHVLPLVGRHEEANKYFLRAHCIHKAVIKEPTSLCDEFEFSGLPISDYTPKANEFWHHSHNLELFGFNLMRTRNLELAEEIFRERCQAGDCSSLAQFYLGEGNFEQAESFLTAALNDPANQQQSGLLTLLKIQSLIGLNSLSEASQLWKSSGLPTALPNHPRFDDIRATIYMYVIQTEGSLGNLSGDLKQALELATSNPNFDTWAHVLPLLRKVYRVAHAKNATSEAQQLLNAINAIDEGHPL